MRRRQGRTSLSLSLPLDLSQSAGTSPRVVGSDGTMSVASSWATHTEPVEEQVPMYVAAKQVELASSADPRAAESGLMSL